MPNTVLALDFDANEIKAAVVEASFRDYKVLGLHRAEVIRDGRTIAEQLAAFVEAHGLADADTVLSALPGHLITWRKLALPFKDRKRLEQTVPFELESEVPFGLDDVVVDYHVLGRVGDGSSVLAALVDREDLQQHLHTLEEAGLDPKIVDVAPLATLNALLLTEKDAPKDFVFVGGDLRHLVLAVYREGELAGLRTLVPAGPEAATTSSSESADNEIPAGDEQAVEEQAVEEQAVEGQAVGAQPEAAPPDTESVAVDFEDVMREVRWTLTALNGGAVEPRTVCLFWASGDAADDLGLYMARELELDVRRFEDGPSRRMPQPWQKQASDFGAALGLAMREVEPNDSVGVNFRRGEFAYHRAQDEVRQALWRTAGLAALVLLFLLSFTIMEQSRVAARQRVVRTEVEKVLKATLPNVRPGPDPVAQLREAIDADQAKLSMLGEVVPVDGATAVDAMRELAVAIPRELKVDVNEFTMDTGQIRIRAVSDSFETVDTIKQHVADRSYFGGVEVKNVKANREGGVSFMMLLDLGRPGDA